jgi:putative transposase
VKAGETAGYPRFKSSTRYDSFTYKQFGNGPRWIRGSWYSPRLGALLSTGLAPIVGTPKTVPIRREADGWYAGFSCAEGPITPVPLTEQATGIDLGVESFATLADGSQMANPRIFRVAEMNLRRAQRRVSRHTKGSHRRRKAVHLLARAHQRVRRARADVPHQSALTLLRQYDTISHESLQVANLLRNHRNHQQAKAIADVGWRACLSILAFKAAAAGKQVVAVNPAFTSQACSGCGVLVHKGLSVRWHECPECGTSLHRDHNAARNIVRLGRQSGAAGQAVQALTQPIGAYVA